jgi:hypothetical protein
MMQERQEAVGGTTMSDERQCRWAMLYAIRSLRKSVQNGRPISLPNLMRLYQRRCAGGGTGNVQTSGFRRLKNLYRLQQPFRETRWRSWREDWKRPAIDG